MRKSVDEEFEAILMAAKAKKTSMLPAGAPIDLSRTTEFPATPAGTLAHRNDREGTLFLIEQCAADPNYPAMCAASNGHKILAEELMAAHGATIRSVAYGVGMNGDKEWARALVELGANITTIAQGAAFSGHHDWLLELIAQEADIEAIISDILRGGHLADDAKSLRWLSLYMSPETLDNWLGLFRMHNKEFSSDLVELVKKNHVLMKLPKELQFNYADACLLSDQAEQYLGGLYILRILHTPDGIILNDADAVALPPETWISVLSFLFHVDSDQLRAFNKKTQHAIKSKLLVWTTQPDPPTQESKPKPKNDAHNFRQCAIL